MKIAGKYMEDQKYVTVYSGNVMYIIDKASGHCHSRTKVGQRVFRCGTFTQKDYDIGESRCGAFGEFELM